MSRYIDADELIFIGLDNPDDDHLFEFVPKEFIDNAPTADVVENKVLRLLLDWAIECGFGYDSIPEEYEKYKDDIQDMSYADGLIYIAMKEVEDELHK